MLRFRPLLLAAAVAASVPLAAQQTWIVDWTGGGHFTDIPSAIAAASPGDTVLVRAGEYRGFALRKGLQVLGDPGVTLTDTRASGFVVEGIPAGQSAVVRGFGGNLTFGMSVTLFDNEGPVHLERLRASGGFISNFRIERSRNVALTDVRVGSPGLTVRDSTVCLTRCDLTGPPGLFTAGGPGLTLQRSRVWFSESVCRGGSANPSFPADPAPGVLAEQSHLFVAGDASTVITTGTSTLSNPIAAIVTVTSTVVVDPNVTLTSHAGAPPHSGSGSFTRRPVPSLRAEVPVPGQLDVRLFAPGALRGYVLLSLVPPVPVPLGPAGDLWVDLVNVVLDGGAVPGNGIRSATIMLPPLPPGVAVMTQGLVVYGSGPLLSAPAGVTLGF